MNEIVVNIERIYKLKQEFFDVSLEANCLRNDLRLLLNPSYNIEFLPEDKVLFLAAALVEKVNRIKAIKLKLKAHEICAV